MQSITKMYNPSTDFIMLKNNDRFLGKGHYAHPAKFIAVEKTASSASTKSHYEKQPQNTLQE
ncbi:MAG TPA: hypothetical protein VMU83_06280 [Hanamia sp.]|nr:hypothetical protein [Hanamia sp.]